MKSNLKNLIEKNREILQLGYGITLIVLIPSLIVFNTVFIINKYNKSINVILQRQALTIGRTISTLMAGDLPWDYFIQAKLEMLMKSNPEVLELSVLMPEGESFKIIASSEDQLIGQTTDLYYFKIAWAQPLGDGLATASDFLGQYGAVDGGPVEENFWLVAMPMIDSDGVRSALLTVKLSSEIVNELTSYNRNLSIYLLIGTVFIVMLFLLVAVRLWDYALLYRKTKELDNMKNEFISMASHELRTPVTGIRGHSAMILDGSLGRVSDKAKRSVEMIGSAAERLAVLVEDLLNVSRIEQGRLKIESKPTSIDRIVKGTVDELLVQADAKKLKLAYDQKSEGLSKVNVDSDRLRQILINLIGNAIKYTEKGQIEVIVEEGRNDSVRIMVKDTGIGMGAKEKERLFEKFYRIQNDHTRDITGTGLGLWITKQLVEMMNGTIHVDSIENVGTQFTVEFPVTR